MNYKCITNEPSGGAQDCQTRSINHRSNKTVGSVSSSGREGLAGGEFHARRRVANTNAACGACRKRCKGENTAEVVSLWAVLLCGLARL